MKAKLESPQIKVWTKNERCLCNGRRAYFLKYSHGGFRCSVSQCEGKDGGEILNWKIRKNVSLDDLSEYPDKMPAGFWWDDRGFLCYPSLPVPREDDSPNLTTGENQLPAENDSPNLPSGENQISPTDDSPNLTTGENQISPTDDSPNLTTGENQISPASMTDTKNAPGELWEYAPADLTGFSQATLQDALRIAGQLRKPALLKLRNFIDERIAILDEQLEEKDVPVKSGRQIVRTLVAGSVVYRQEKVSCGKPTCNSCPHGPYWYSYQRVTGRVKSKYLGKKL